MRLLVTKIGTVAGSLLNQVKECGHEGLVGAYRLKCLFKGRLGLVEISVIGALKLIKRVLNIIGESVGVVLNKEVE